MNSISRIYDELLDKGINITELYIYHRIMSEDYTYGLSETDIMNLVREIYERYACDEQFRSLDEHIDAVLNGTAEDDDEWD